MRNYGLLQPISSLPSDYGIGDLGKTAFEFIDIMKENGACVWQILPLNPIGYGNSPYQALSAYAGDEIYINLEQLVDMQYLDEQLLNEFNANASFIDYDQVRKYKTNLLETAFSNFHDDLLLEIFTKENTWVIDYAIFRFLKEKNFNKEWIYWEHPQLISNELKHILKVDKNVKKHIFYQMMFFKQWFELKKYANENNIIIIGDMPFYPGLDSCDVWLNREAFQINPNLSLKLKAGVPPDYFSTTGQLWGNPIYDWDYLKKTNYQLWVDKITHNAKLYDVIRIDHFRAFDSYWAIDGQSDSAVNGQWLEAPGYEVLETISQKVKDVSLIAEDLGDIRKETTKLREKFKIPGMKVIQFSFTLDEQESNFVDYPEMIVYTGTHDNQTLNGWYNKMSWFQKRKVKKFFKLNEIQTEDIALSFIEYAFQSIGQICIIPTQDVLSLDDEARLNTPQTINNNNWKWKLNNFTLLKEKMPAIKQLAEEYDKHY